MSNFGLTESANGLASLGLECIGEPYPDTASYINITPRKLKELKGKARQDCLDNRDPQ